MKYINIILALIFIAIIGATMDGEHIFYGWKDWDLYILIKFK